MVRVLVVDLEAACSDDGSISVEEMETIEIGACWATEEVLILHRFQHFVRPLEWPVLMPFCMALTRISQRDVDQASLFPVAARALSEFASQFAEPGATWLSWGAYDMKQIAREIVRHDIASPLAMPHQNGKKMFAKVQRIGKEVGMAKACELAKIPMEGLHHRGLDDSVNIARLMPSVLGNAFLREAPNLTSRPNGAL